MSFLLILCFFGFIFVKATFKKHGVVEWDKIIRKDDSFCVTNTKGQKTGLTWENVEVCVPVMNTQTIRLYGGDIKIVYEPKEQNTSTKDGKSILLHDSKVTVSFNDITAEINNLYGNRSQFSTGLVKIQQNSNFLEATSSKFDSNKWELFNYVVGYKEYTISGGHLECEKTTRQCVAEDSTLHQDTDTIAHFEKVSLSKVDRALKFTSGAVQIADERISEVLPSIDKLVGVITEESDHFKVSIGNSTMMKVDKKFHYFDLHIKGDCQSVITDISGIWQSPFKMAGGIDISLSYHGLLSIEGSYSCVAVDPPSEFKRSTLRSKFERTVYDENLNTSIDVSGPTTSGWVSFAEIPDKCASAFVFSEDGRFWNHKGIDLKAFSNAMNENIKARKWKRGGSTISMQTAKNLWLTREKTLSRKIAELFYTMHLESILSKEEILETYLNIAEMGPGLYGLRNAADYHFDEGVYGLTNSQCALLTSLLPNPKRSLFTEEGTPNSHRQKHMETIMKRIEKYGN